MNNQRLRFTPTASHKDFTLPPAMHSTSLADGVEVARSGHSVWAPLGAIALGMAVMFALLRAFGAVATTPLGSLLGTSLACIAGLILISRVHYTRLLGSSFTAVVLLVFVVKIAIGVGHYLYFFEPNYFSQPLGFFPWIFDYGQLPEGMQSISTSWRLYGFTDLPVTQIGEKSQILAVYHALLYYLNGEYFLNFVPWASFHTLLVAFLVTSLAVQQGATRRQATGAFVLASLQPLFLYSDLPQRDIVGQFFVVLAVYLLVQSFKETRRLVLVLPIALILVYAQRWVYPYIILIYSLLVYLLSKRRTAVALALLSIGVTIWLAAGTFINEVTLANYSQLPITSINRLPAAIVVGIVGPFPWTQVFDVQDAFIHLPPSFAQAWLGMVIWVIVLPRVWRQWRAMREVDVLALISFLFALSGTLTTATHTGYIHIATVLLLPMACRAPLRDWARTVVMVFYLYLIGHIVFFGLGLSDRNLFIR